MTEHSDAELVDIYRSTRTIAVVGASTDTTKPAHHIPAYLQSQGFRVIPVNPVAAEVFGEPAVATVGDITEPVDVVQVFRPQSEAPAIAREAGAIGAHTLWLQVGIESGEAAQIAGEAGLTVVMDTCMAVQHRRLTQLGLL